MQSTKREYEKKKALAIAQMKLLAQSKQKVSLKEKTTSHFFRQRVKKKRLNLLPFTSVIEINTENLTADVEGLINFFDFSQETLKHGLLPAVTPELRSITIGGTISGLGVEATSFKYGLVHETLCEFDLLTATGDVLTCSESENRDVFHTVPNALGTLGYVLRAKVKLIPAKPFIKVAVKHFSDPESYFESLSLWCRKKIDFLDGIIFGPGHYVLMIGTFIDDLPSNKSVFDPLVFPFFQALAKKNTQEMYFTVKGYLWRWDYDCFWGTDRTLPMLGKILLKPWFRRSLGRYLLRSDVLLTLRRKLDKLQSNHFFAFFPKERRETLLQDAGVPLGKCVEFINWYQEKINVYPLWICPVAAQKKSGTYPLSRWEGDIIVDIGFYTSKKLPQGVPDNYYNLQIEAELNKLHSVKGMYSTSFYSKEDFWKIYDKERYFKVKNKLDPKNSFPDLYQKAVGTKTM